MSRTQDFEVPIQLLGQAGCCIRFPGLTLYVDPYLSNSVEELDGPDLKRQTPIAVRPDEVTDADWVLVTHEHIDHCDPHTLPAMAEASPRCKFLGPAVVLAILSGWGIAGSRLHLAEEMWLPLSEDVSVHAVPAAHPDIQIDEAGRLKCVGYVVRYGHKRIYLAGDTCVREEILAALRALSPIDAALLPVNEHNFFRGRRGITGNMSVREAFELARETGIRRVIPVHWDMFAANAVHPEEIELIYEKTRPGFELLMGMAPQTLQV